MKLLANENFPLSAVEYIEQKGHDIIFIGLDYKGTTDREVINLAIEESRTILTFDKDYGELIFKHNFRPPAGVIYLRLKKFTPEEPGKLISNLIDSADFNPVNKLTVLTETGIRQRKY
jgi:predicted nuclease of predicted toxin-antitoxin system